MKRQMSRLEKRRLVLQAELDAGKNQVERNRRGQFATPTRLAADILQYAKAYMGECAKVRFLDPAIGTGSFYSALISLFLKDHIERSIGYEVDSYYGSPAAKLWENTGLEVRLEDFTRVKPPPKPEKFNLLICNPPYVRHHHIVNGEKHRLKICTRNACGFEFNGLAGLYCYFLGLCHEWMADGGLAGWLIPSEFMTVNYGLAVKHYLLDKVTLTQIHRFDPNDVQFGDALVSSAVVWFRKEKPPRDHEVRFTYGGSLQYPKLDRLVPVTTLRIDPKWTRYPMKERHEAAVVSVLADFFTIKRGLVTGSNSYFILSAEEIEQRKLPMEVFRPILPSPRYLPDDEIMADNKGNPVLRRRLFLLDCKLEQDEIKKRYPKLWHYLEEGKAQGIAERYLCRHRIPWYMQENRLTAPLVCTYLGRSSKRNGSPFRFILNHSKATAANVYLMLYPKGFLAAEIERRPELKRRIWVLLNEIAPEVMLGEGRVYGGGLHKLEPKELGNVPVPAISNLVPKSAPMLPAQQYDLFKF
jgi:hypothetical protein